MGCCGDDVCAWHSECSCPSDERPHPARASSPGYLAVPPSHSTGISHTLDWAIQSLPQKGWSSGEHDFFGGCYLSPLCLGPHSPAPRSLPSRVAGSALIQTRGAFVWKQKPILRRGSTEAPSTRSPHESAMWGDRPGKASVLALPCPNSELSGFELEPRDSPPTLSLKSRHQVQRAPAHDAELPSGF